MLTQIAIILFWVLIFIVFYAYVGYGILLFFIIKLKRLFSKQTVLDIPSPKDLPSVSFIVAAYNEEDYILEKIKNSFAFEYPKDKIEFVFVTDGSSDNTPNMVERMIGKTENKLVLFHEDERKGKIHAVERIMPFIKSEIVVFTDANTMVNKEAILHIVKHYQDPTIGAVAGEKRIRMDEKSEASSAGEGLYWKYESTLKKWDAELYSTIGGAGELFSIRRNLYIPVPKDSLIEDFVMTMQIAMNGYKIAYEPSAYAVESSSASVSEELKRKVRIAAGGLQTVGRMKALLNPFKHGILTFQYLSHRVLRWTLAPLALPFIFLLNLYLAFAAHKIYAFILICQILFYGMAILGYVFEKKKMRSKAFFVPFYFSMMNFAVFKGYNRLRKGQQTVVWEKAKRAA